MLALGKHARCVAPVRTELRCAPIYSLDIWSYKDFSGYLYDLFPGNHGNNYKLQETICCVRTLLQYVETEILSRIRTQGLLWLLLSRLVQGAFVNKIVLRLAVLRKLTNKLHPLAS